MDHIWRQGKQLKKVFDCSRCNANIEYRRETSKTFVVVFWKFSPLRSLEKLIDDCNDSLYLALFVNPWADSQTCCELWQCLTWYGQSSSSTSCFAPVFLSSPLLNQNILQWCISLCLQMWRIPSLVKSFEKSFIESSLLCLMGGMRTFVCV